MWGEIEGEREVCKENVMLIQMRSDRGPDKGLSH